MIGSPRPEPPLEILEGLRHPVPVEEASASEARRRATIDAMARAIREGRGQEAPRGRTFVLLGVAAAAALLLGFVGWRLAPERAEGGSGSASVVAPAGKPGSQLRVTSGLVATTSRGRGLAAVPVGSVVSVERGDEIQSAADAQAVLMLPRGVRVEIGGSTKAQILAATETDQRVRCDLGKTRVSVPKPGGPRTFVVETPDAEVIVHGTEFSVLVEKDEPNAPATVTSVVVTRGAVLVVYRGEQRLVPAGEHWSSRLAIAMPVLPVAPSAAARSEDVPGVERAERIRDGTRSGILPSARGTGSLAEQNRLFRAALDARQAGDDPRAIAYLDELLARFPKTTLAEEARFARARSLKRLAQTSKTSSDTRN